jgi:hypothetical protein
VIGSKLSTNLSAFNFLINIILIVTVFVKIFELCTLLKVYILVFAGLTSELSHVTKL